MGNDVDGAKNSDAESREALLLAQLQNHQERARSHEALRSETTNFSIALVAGLTALSVLSEDHESVSGAGIIGASVWGFLLSYKHFERHRRHLRVCEKLAQLLNGLAAYEISTCEKAAAEAHKRAFAAKYWLGKQVENIPFHVLYMTIYALTSVIGAALLVM